MNSKHEGGKFSSYLKGTDDLISPVDIKKILILDLGSNTIRLGLSGENYPLLTLSNIIAKPGVVSPNDLTQLKLPEYFGNKAISEYSTKNKSYYLSYPLLNKSIESTLWEQNLKSNYESYKQNNKLKNQNLKNSNKELSDQNIPVNNQTGSNSVNTVNIPEKQQEIIFSKDNYNDLENYFRYIFEEVLQLESSNIELMVLHSLATPNDFRLELAEMFFENFRLQSLNFMNTAVSSLFSSGRTSGVTVEMGHSSTNIVPIYEGLVLKHAQSIGTYGGRDVSIFINSYLLDKEISLKSKGYEPFSMIEQIKSKIAYTALNYEFTIEGIKELGIEESHFELPDGTILEFDKNVKYSSGEMLLNPGKGYWTGFSNFNSLQNPLHERIYDSLQRVEHEMSKRLSSNILIVGGSSLTSNLVNKLRVDYNKNLPDNLKEFKHQLNLETNVPYSAWIGGSILGSISTFQNLKIKKSEFDDSGDLKHNFLYKRTFM